jgi:hypothetical protein
MEMDVGGTGALRGRDLYRISYLIRWVALAFSCLRYHQLDH